MKETEGQDKLPRLKSGYLQDKTQEKYKSLKEAKLEKISAETELKLLQLSLDQLSEDLKSVDSLSDAQKREKELEKRDIETKICVLQASLARFESATDVLGCPIVDHEQLSVCEIDDCARTLATDMSEMFLNAAQKYTDYIDLLKFSQKPVLARGVTQVSWLVRVLL